MSGIKDLPYLVRLLDDESPVVRAAVKDALADFGDGLYDDLRSANIVLEAGQRELIEELHAEVCLPGRGFNDSWENWVAAGEADLELGLGLISWGVRGDRGAIAELGTALDQLATVYREELARRDHVAGVHSLSEFLFKAHRFRGDDGDYYLPRNSDLISVIDRRRGNPISLACIYRLVGERVGLEIGGCNFPGHFMARVVVENQVFLIDCFNGGRFVSAAELRGKLENAAPFIEEDPGVGAIVRRALMNLVNAYTQLGESERAEDFRRLVGTL